MSAALSKGSARVASTSGCCCLLAVLTALVLPAASARAEEADPFAIADFSTQTTRASESQPYLNEPYEFTQAGGHPFALTTRVEFASEPASTGPDRLPVRDPRNVVIQLPSGLLANPQAVATCEHMEAICPTDSQVGYFVLRANGLSLLAPVVNMRPSGAEPAELGLETPIGLVPLQGQLTRTPSGYALAVAASGLVEIGVVSLEITLWGVPAEKAHDPQRGRTCTGNEFEIETNCSGGGVSSGEEARAFLTMPSDCGEQLPTATVWANSWEQSSYVHAESSLAASERCERLPFAPQLALRPDRLAASAPVGVDLSLEVPASEAPSGVAAPPLRSATITLPAGMSINPAAGAGARVCSASGSEAFEMPTGLGPGGAPLDPDEIGEGEQAGPGGEAVLAPGHCPEASTVGLAEAQSPLLAGALAGRVYLAAPLCGSAGQSPCGEGDAASGRLFRVFVELGGRGEQKLHGLVIKLAGAIHVDPANGQLTLELSEAPQLPLSRLELHLFGGERALLVNPAACGQALTSSVLQPWGEPDAPNASPDSYFVVTGCAAQPQPLAPTLLAGSYNTAAGAFTPFVFDLRREAGEQQFSSLQFQAPPGLQAVLAGVGVCGEVAAGQGACPLSALIGSSRVALGSGSEPLYLSGQVYLTGPYRGAPFGLAIVTPATVGPLNLGQVVIRARLNVDPSSGALTVSSDPLPAMLLGVPLQLRELRLDIDRSGFLANPTSCAPQRVLARVAGAGGALSTVSDPFGLADCRELAFTPKLAAFTSAAAGIRDGASLDLRLSQSAGPQSGQANLARLRIALPRTLPTRLTALQSACRPAVFALNPAGCPAASLIGVARAVTPLISGQLAGPVYLLAHGRGQPPSPTVVLQGGGVRLDLTGATTIERTGRTAISFSSLPDLPLRSVELYLPRGPHSALSAPTSLCSAAGPTHTLALPLELAAHNGLVLHRNATIAVRGCPPAPRHKKR